MNHIWIPLFLLAVTASAHAQDKPNVVVMLADNVGYGDIGAYGAGEVRGMPTSRIDQLASEGLRLTQFLVEPGCTSSRAALMTGRYSSRAGLSTIIIVGTPNTLKASEVTLGELFKGQGYATGIVGKWHLGASEQSWPTRPTPAAARAARSAARLAMRWKDRCAKLVTTSWFLSNFGDSG